MWWRRRQWLGGRHRSGSGAWKRLYLGRHGGLVVVVIGGSIVSGGGIDVFGGSVGVICGSVGVVCAALFVGNLFIVADFVIGKRTAGVGGSGALEDVGRRKNQQY